MTTLLVVQNYSLTYPYTAGQDYVTLENSAATFGPGGRNVCVRINLTEDLEPEDHETFSVVLNTSDTSVNLGLASSVVTILNDDGTQVDMRVSCSSRYCGPSYSSGHVFLIPVHLQFAWASVGLLTLEQKETFLQSV